MAKNNDTITKVTVLDVDETKTSKQAFGVFMTGWKMVQPEKHFNMESGEQTK